MKNTKKQQVIINYLTSEECRIAILEDGVLEEFYSERTSEHLHVGNIYLGTIQNVEPSIQAAFVDFGIGRNGFLHISDVHPMYFPGVKHEDTESVGRKTPHRDRPPIQQCLKSGQKIVVQVIKEGIGTKGPTLTSYPSIPGRYLVMMPNMEHHGVTRKLEDLDARREAKKILNSLELPKEYGFILRTAGLHRTKAELKRDLAYLTRLWKQIDKKQKHAATGTELYAESDLLMRTVRDAVSPDVERIWVDDPDALNRVEEYLYLLSPRQRKTKLLLHHRPTPIFHDFGVEKQLESMYDREVQLPSGGSIVIDSAEALVAIDVNSGKSRKYHDAETMAYQVNLEAVDEIARQLRLRDLGGLVVLDLIDMRDPKHQRAVEARLKENLKRDRAKSEMQRISKFGILEMTRQRMRPAVQKTHFSECPNCGGRGFVKTSEASVGDALRNLAYLLHDKRVQKIEMVVSTTTASALLSNKRKQLADIEEQTGKTVDIRISKAMPVDRIDFYAYDDNFADIDLSKLLIEPRDPSTADPDPSPAPTVESSSRPQSHDEITEDIPQAVSGNKDTNRTTAQSDDSRSAKPQSRNRRRRRRSRSEDPDTKQQEQKSREKHDTGRPDESSESSETKKKTGNRRRSTRSSKKTPASTPQTNSTNTETSQPAESGAESTNSTNRKKTKRVTKTKHKTTGNSKRKEPSKVNQSQDDSSGNTTEQQKDTNKKRRRRSRSRSKTTNQTETKDNPPSTEATKSHSTRKKQSSRKPTASAKPDSTTNNKAKPASQAEVSTPKRKSDTKTSTTADSKTAKKTDGVVKTTKRRRLYGSRRRLKPAELAQLSEQQDQ